MGMPKPSEHHLRLRELAGRWEGHETMHPSPWDPKGGAATGRTSSCLALGGFAVITDYEQERDGVVTFTGHGVWTYDAEDGCYVLHWFDCMGSPPEVFRGNFTGSVLAVSHGGRMHVRLTYDFTQPDRMTSRMEMSADGAEWKTLFDGVYERKPTTGESR